MPKKSNGLSETRIKRAKIEDRTYEMFDGDGLVLRVYKNGTKSFLFRFSDGHGKRTYRKVGDYPDIDLDEARDRRSKMRRILATKMAVPTYKNQRKIDAIDIEGRTFEVIALKWFQSKNDWTEKHRGLVTNRCERYLFPYIGHYVMDDITAGLVYETVNKIVTAGYRDTASRCRNYCDNIFVFGMALGVCNANPASGLHKVIEPPRGNHFAAPTEEKDVQRLIRAVHSYRGMQIVTAALQLSPLLFMRPGELRKTIWRNVDLEAGMLHVPKKVTKMKRDTHNVPLSSQAVEIFRSLRSKTDTPSMGDENYVFQSMRSASRPMSDAAVNAGLRSMGFDTKTEITGHGFRAMARTILAERGWDPRIIERQLDHGSKESLGEAYDRALYMDQRPKMMQEWSDYLYELKNRKD